MNSRLIKVMHIGHGGCINKPGIASGIGRVIVDIVSYHDREKYEPIVVFFGRDGGGSIGAREILDDLGIKYYGIEWHSKYNLFQYLQAIKKVEYLIKEESPTVIILHGFWPILLFAKVANNLKIPVILAVDHGPQVSLFTTKKILINYVLRNNPINSIIFVSESSKQWALSNKFYIFENAYVVENGVDLEKYLKLKPSLFTSEPYIITMVSRIDLPQKDPLTLVRAGKLLLSKGYPIKIRFVGDGNARIEVEKLAKSLGISSFVEITGYTNNVQEQLVSTDIFVLSTNWEGFALSLIEAMATGLPVVSSRVTGVVDIIEEGKNGLLFSKGNYIELSKILITLIENKTKAINLGKEAKNTAKSRFDRLRMVKEYEDIISKYLKI